jgi:hypothetical protein
MRRNFLLIGQSNMCDRAAIGQMPAFENRDRVFIFKRPLPLGAAEIGAVGEWVSAEETSVVDPVGALAGHGGALALAFADRLAALRQEDEVGLVPRSHPGTEIHLWRKWNRNAGLYGMAVERAWQAAADGTMSGVVWWQGEQSAYNSVTATNWAERFSRLVSDLRVDLQNLNLPVVFVRLGTAGARYPGMAYWNTVRAQMTSITMRNVKRVDIDDVQALPDRLHYPAASYATIGVRIANAMETML